MADWGPVVMAVVLFVLLTPGLLYQIPGKGRVVEFGNMQTSGISILVHTVIYFGLVTIFLIAISNGTHNLAKLAASARASKVTRDPPSSDR
ncbi:hypothetical protein RJ639_046916 [Escallonia herrerae]|uniref:Transmembrane protein n=1 Tax=Escallonia herrerae TaxID=1293975 RepID=A0AA89B3I1_9ASTE|nr:hypothetical protein RJ639_046916 [Escallonia herrerae]